MGRGNEDIYYADLQQCFSDTEDFIFVQSQTETGELKQFSLN